MTSQSRRTEPGEAMARPAPRTRPLRPWSPLAALFGAMLASALLGACGGDGSADKADGAADASKDASDGGVVACSKDGDLCNDGDPCTQGDHCEGTTCVGKALDCDDGDVCTVDSCKPGEAACSHEPVSEGGACDDGSVCSEGDACKAGSCAGSVKNCDDDNACTADACDPASGCNHTPKDDGVCNDGDLCTPSDSCVGGVCKPGKAVECLVDGPCLVASCDPKTGQCLTQTAADGSACDTGDACLQAGSCSSGSCVAAKKDCDDGEVCTVDACETATGACTHDPKAQDGAPCDADGDACSNSDSCSGGLCKAGAAVVCEPAGPCADVACDGKTGACVVTPKADATPCTAVDLCVVAGACAKGTCLGTPKTCDDGEGCTQDSCDSVTGVCKHDAAATQNKPCDADGSVCTVGDACDGGSCKAGPALSCDDGNPCTKGACDAAAGCTQTNADGQACDDGDGCSEGDTCGGGSCKPGKSVCGCAKDADCEAKDDGNPCNGVLACDLSALPYTCKPKPGTVVVCDPKAGGACADSACDPASGTCKQTAKDEGTACNADDSVCTQDDGCFGGVCTAGQAVSCDDGNPCTVDSCHPTKGCEHVAKTSGACDADGSACTEQDSCKAGVCVAGPTKTCTGGGVCTVAACVPATGACATTPKADGTPCDADGSICTANDGCLGGFCTPGLELNCSDDNPCTDDICDSKGGCSHVNNSSPCDKDGNACTVNDACSKGSCFAGPVKSCPTSGSCETAKCDAKTGGCVVTPKADGTACDADKNVCTSGDACSAGACVPGALANCDDGKACTNDSCDPTKGCKSVASTAPCNDGNACTIGDTCDATGCKAGSALLCDDQETCTTDSCDSKTGCKHVAISGCAIGQKTWTVLVYMAADNNLEQSALDDIDEMLAAATGSNLKFVVQIDRSAGYSSKALGAIGNFTGAKRLLISDGKLSVLDDLGETDTGAEATLSAFIGWGAVAYPADRRMLVLWNHGQAWSGYGTDDDDGNLDGKEASVLTLAETASAITKGLATAKLSKFDLIGFDACLMGDLLVLKAMKGFADYMISSQDIEPAHGWDYNAFTAIVDSPAITVEALGKLVVDGFYAQATKKKQASSVTLALYKLANVQAVEDKVQALAYQMKQQVAVTPNALGIGRNNALEFGRSTDPDESFYMVDVGDLATEAAKQSDALGPSKDALLKALDDLVVAKVAGEVTARATGVALYHPPLKPLYSQNYQTLGLGSWLDFVTGYYAAADKITVLPTLEKASGDGKGGTAADTVLPLPYIEDFRCDNGTSALWAATKPSWTTASWAVDATPPGALPTRCTLNFNDGKSYACTGSPLSTSEVVGPWLDLSAGHVLWVRGVPAGTLAPGDTVSVAWQTYGGPWTTFLNWSGTSPWATTLDLRAWPSTTKVRFRFLVTSKLCLGSAAGPAIRSFEVHAPLNPCSTVGAGSYCAGRDRVTCSSAHQVDARERCSFGCEPGDKANATCRGEITGLPGEVQLSCSKGEVRLTANLVPGVIDAVTNATLRYGYAASEEITDSTGKVIDVKVQDRLLGTLPATVAANGTITASWDQRALVAQFPSGQTPLFARRYRGKTLDHQEVPMKTQVVCDCKEAGNPGYSDLDGDGKADCVDDDIDGDGLLNTKDNCVYVPNANQADANKDGIGNACSVSSKGYPTMGKPKVGCVSNPGVTVKQKAVLHVDLAQPSQALVGKTLYGIEQHHVSEISPSPSGTLIPKYRPVKTLSAQKPVFATPPQAQPIPVAELGSTTFRMQTLDEVVMYAGGKPVYDNGRPVSFLDGFDIHDYTFEIAVENMAGKGDSIVYRGPLPLNCTPAQAPCAAAGQIRDCLGVCRPASLKGDGVCDKGENLGAHFKCARLGWDNGDCSECPSEDEIPDCQGTCFAKTNLQSWLADRICQDGAQTLGSADQGPDLNCAAFGYDGGDCTYPAPLHARECSGANETTDCKQQCVSHDTLLVAGPGSASTCQERYNCAKFDYDNGRCAPPANATCPSACSKHGSCVGGLCACNAGWSGYDCSVPAATGSCCQAHSSPLCDDLVVAACVCAGKPACCTGSWGADCVARAMAACSAAKTCGASGASDPWANTAELGAHHGLAVGLDGQVRAWGENAFGQLGYGDKVDRFEPALLSSKPIAGLVGVTSIAAGGKHSCAVSIGKVYCWGAGGEGQLGNGKTTDQTKPVVVTLPGPAVSVVAGEATTCAILSNGMTACWGRNDKGQLGNGISSAPVLTPKVIPSIPPQAKFLTLGRDHGCALGNDGRLRCWGSRAYGAVGDGKLSTTTLALPTPIDANVYLYAAAGTHHTCAARVDGSVHCWGRNDRHQLGSGTKLAASAVPVKVPDLGGIGGRVAAGRSHSCARRSDGAVLCWGAADQLQLGKPAGWDSAAAVQVPNATGTGNLGDVVRLTAGGEATCAIEAKGLVTCWGANQWGQLANGVVGTPPCETSCSGLSCGLGGSGSCTASCGLCDAGTTCKGGECAACVPNCTGKVCGSDGCGGFCGTCSSSTYCASGKCTPIFGCTGLCGTGTLGLDPTGIKCKCNATSSSLYLNCSDYKTVCGG